MIFVGGGLCSEVYLTRLDKGVFGQQSKCSEVGLCFDGGGGALFTGLTVPMILSFLCLCQCVPVFVCVHMHMHACGVCMCLCDTKVRANLHAVFFQSRSVWAVYFPSSQSVYLLDPA